MVKSSPGVTPKPRFGPNLDSTLECLLAATGRDSCCRVNPSQVAVTAVNPRHCHLARHETRGTNCGSGSTSERHHASRCHGNDGNTGRGGTHKRPTHRGPPRTGGRPILQGTDPHTGPTHTEDTQTVSAPRVNLAATIRDAWCLRHA